MICSKNGSNKGENNNIKISTEQEKIKVGKFNFIKTQEKHNYSSIFISTITDYKKLEKITKTMLNYSNR
jgi:hypothetical protein